MKPITRNTLFFGDNLDVLEKHVPEESVDLIYLDPPFNSARQYNLLFKQVKGDPSPAQIMAFTDTWSWNPGMIEEFMQTCGHPKLRRLIDGLYSLLQGSEMMAYIVMMAPRLLELSQKIKPTGSLVLHCDPAASHYLKLVLDVVFGPQNFRNEITWKRSDTHNDAKRQFARTSDRLLFFGKTKDAKFKPTFMGHADRTLQDWYIYLELSDGTVRKMTQVERASQKIPKGTRRFNADNTASPNPRPNLMYEYKGYRPHANGWRYSREKMEELDAAGLLLFPASADGRIMRKRYLDEQKGAVLGDIWDDISMVRAGHAENSGYPTQKPVALLERVINSTTDEGDTVLDPFCGCGTSIMASQNLGRAWIGIDITYLAIDVIEARLMARYGLERGTNFNVEGLPKDLESAKAFFENTRSDSHKQFEMWAVKLVGGQPREKKGGDKGIDGDLLLITPEQRHAVAPIQVKGGHANPSNVRDFAHVIERESAPFGLFLSLDPCTKGMEDAANYGGVIESRGRKVKKLQIMSIGDVLEHGPAFDVPDGFTIPPSRYRPQGALKL